jgi:hypothetical protein
MILWMMIAAAVIGLILYRAWIARREDDALHVHQSEIGLVLRSFSSNVSDSASQTQPQETTKCSTRQKWKSV